MVTRSVSDGTRSKRTSKDEFIDLQTLNAIHEIVKKNVRSEIYTVKDLVLYLQYWWCKTYNRPLKDPLLKDYTVEELLYEFYTCAERENAKKESIGQDDDKMEEERLKANLDWAEQEEKKELERIQNEQKTMEKQVQAGKKLFGEKFGEDIEEDFADA
jgi:hypothetical protein